MISHFRRLILMLYVKYGIDRRMTEMRKITAFIPAELLSNAQSHTGLGVTETLRIALERFSHAEWCRKLLELEGKIKLDIDLEELRKDREFDEHGNVIS